MRRSLLIFCVNLFAISMLVTGCWIGRSLGNEDEFLNLARNQVRTLEITTKQRLIMKNLGSYTVYRGLVPHEFYFVTLTPVDRPTEEIYVYEKGDFEGSTEKVFITHSLVPGEQNYLQEWKEKKIRYSFINES